MEDGLRERTKNGDGRMEGQRQREERINSRGTSFKFSLLPNKNLSHTHTYSQSLRFYVSSYIPLNNKTPAKYLQALFFSVTECPASCLCEPKKTEITSPFQGFITECSWDQHLRKGRKEWAKGEVGLGCRPRGSLK